MGTFLLTSTPLYGHVAPVLAIGRALRARGHDVAMLTGTSFRAEIETAGLTFLPLPADADFDDAHLDDWLPGRAHRRGLDAGRHDIVGLFVRPLVAQHQAFAAALRATRYDGVLCESGFLGAMPTLLTGGAPECIPIVGISATPISTRSIDCAPFGSGLDPGHSAHTRRRNRFLNLVLAHGPLRPIQAVIDDSLSSLGIVDATCNYFDYITLFDVTFQLAVRGFEYPRRELPSSVRFVGPIPSAHTRVVAYPQWWGELDGNRPVVHVTQGTLANADATRLLIPAMRALADEDVLVVASTGGRDVAAVLTAFGGRLPANARIAEFLPYDELLAHTDVMVSNGGYGGVQRALAHGVPLVVAGSSEDKPEVAARVAWSGAGIDLHTGRASETLIRTAVRTVLDDPSYRLRAERLRDETALLADPVDVVVEHLEAASTTSVDDSWGSAVGR